MESVMIDDRALATSMGLGRSERILAAIPMSHAYGLSSVAFPALTRGCLLVVPDEGNPLGTMHAAQAGDVTFLPTVPAYLQVLLRMAAPPPLPASLRLVITAGAPLHPETAARFRQTYDRPVHVFYGASEVGGICFDRTGDAAERGTLGTPVDGVRISLAEAHGADEPGVGVVVVSSGAVALGYVPQADPALGGGRFRSSDLGELRNGELVLHGRIDDLINVKGKKVRPGEVEAVLRGLDAVDDAIVLGLPATDGGQMVRAVVAGERSRLEVPTVLTWCREHLAAHKVPRGIVLVDEIPRTSRGKVDRTAVRALAAGSDAGTRG
jgi:long-chain acyl-CoA synthetase